MHFEILEERKLKDVWGSHHDLLQNRILLYIIPIFLYSYTVPVSGRHDVSSGSKNAVQELFANNVSLCLLDSS